MKTYSVVIIVFVSLFQQAYSEGILFNKYSGFTIDNVHSPYKNPFYIQSHLMCLTQCNRESNCLTVHFNKLTKTCSFYDSIINSNNLVSQSSSVVFIIKSN
jgi:hypothetical protein